MRSSNRFWTTEQRISETRIYRNFVLAISGVLIGGCGIVLSFEAYASKLYGTLSLGCVVTILTLSIVAIGWSMVSAAKIRRLRQEIAAAEQLLQNAEVLRTETLQFENQPTVVYHVKLSDGTQIQIREKDDGTVLIPSTSGLPLSRRYSRTTCNVSQNNSSSSIIAAEVADNTADECIEFASEGILELIGGAVGAILD